MVYSEDRQKKSADSQKKLNRKERILKYMAHMKPLRGTVCLLCIVFLFGALVVINYLPDNRISENTSVDSLTSHLKSGNTPILKAGFTGDMMLGRSVERAANFNGGYDQFFAYIKDFWPEFDIVMGNLEHPLIDADDRYIKAEKEIFLSGDKECLPGIKNAGFTIIGVANNHMMDYGEKALALTLEELAKVEIPHVGAGLNVDEAMRFDNQDYNGLKVAIVAVTDISPHGFSATNQGAGVSSTKSADANYLETVIAARETADIVIVYVHWGDEYTTVISDRQRQVGRDLIDAGADFVMGSHAHVIQPVEIYHDKIIFYGLGNFVMDQGWSTTKDSTLLRMCLDEEGNSVFELIPLRIMNGTPAETKNPFYTNRIFRVLTKKLGPSCYTIENNRLYIYPPQLKLTRGGKLILEKNPNQQQNDNRSHSLNRILNLTRPKILIPTPTQQDRE